VRWISAGARGLADGEGLSSVIIVYSGRYLLVLSFTCKDSAFASSHYSSQLMLSSQHMLVPYGMIKRANLFDRTLELDEACLAVTPNFV